MPKPSHIQFLILTAGLLASALDGPAQTSAPLRLDLAEARRLAIERNWDLLAAKSDVDIATAQRLVAHEFPNPVASLSVSKISADSAHGSSTPVGNGLFDRSYDTVAAVSQLIEIGGKRRARQDMAAAGIAAAQERLADTRRLLDFGVIRAYLGVLTADENARILADSAASLRREADIAQTRVKAGDISTNDRSQIEIASDRLQIEARRAKSDAANARVQLAILLGERRSGIELVVTDSIASLTSRLASEPDSSAPALANRPDVRVAEASVRQAEAGVRLQKAQRVPDPTLSALYEHQPPDQPHTLGLAVSFPIPLWNRNRGNIKAAQALREQTEDNARKVAAQAAADVSIARHDFDSARARRDDYVRNIAPKSASVRETVTFAYQKGGATLLDLLSAQRNDNDVRLAAAQAAADVIVARAALAAALNEKKP